jgi:glutamine synthetase
VKQPFDEIRSSDHTKVKVAVTDVDGILRGKYLHRDKFLGATESGFGFCSVIFGWDANDACYENGVTYTGWHNGYPDALAKIDPATYRNVPWDGGVPFFLADFVADEKGTPLAVCPRQLLKKVIADAKTAGYAASCGMEFEWFNFAETSKSVNEKGFRNMESLTPGMFGYSLLRMNQNREFFNALMDDLAKFRVPIEGLHTETGPGVFEAAILYSDALEAADRAVLFKSGAREIGHRFGILPTFMAKWNMQLPGCSGHTHQSLWDAGRTKNLFYDEKAPNKMSEVFKSYVAGQLACLPEILPFFAPTVNSYKRLVDGYWAPTKVTWGIDNRTVACRAIPGSSKSTRLETRVPGSDVNPYLAVAACIASGLYGVRNKLKLKDAVQGSGYHDTTAERLPRTLFEATRRMEESKIARELFGDAFIDHFAKTRHWEWQQFQSSVTNWELQRYFEII